MEEPFVATSEVPLTDQPLESFDLLLQQAEKTQERLTAELHITRQAVEEARISRERRRDELLKELQSLHQTPAAGGVVQVDFGPTQKHLSRRMELAELKGVLEEELRGARLEVASLETEVKELADYAQSKAARAEREARRADSVALMIEQLTSVRNTATQERSQRRGTVADARQAAQAQFESTVLRQQSEIATLEGKIRALSRVHDSLQNVMFHHSLAASAAHMSSMPAAHAVFEEQLRSPVLQRTVPGACGDGTASASPNQSPSAKEKRFVLPGYVLQSDESLQRRQSSTVMYLRDDSNL